MLLITAKANVQIYTLQEEYLEMYLYKVFEINLLLIYLHFIQFVVCLEMLSVAQAMLRETSN